MPYNKNNKHFFAESENYSAFYAKLLEIVKNNWQRTGNQILNLSDDKSYRILSGKQKDFETLVEMAEFIQIKFMFRAF